MLYCAIVQKIKINLVMWGGELYLSSLRCIFVYLSNTILMIYRCPDGETFTSYQAMCDHMIFLCMRQGDYEKADYYRKEKEKMNKRQEKGFPIFAIIFILGFIVMLIATIGGN